MSIKEIEKKYLVEDSINFVNYLKNKNLPVESYNQMYLQMKEKESFVITKDRNNFYLVVNDENSLQEKLRLEVDNETYNNLLTLDGEKITKNKFSINPFKNTLRVRVINDQEAIFCIKGQKSEDGLSCPEIEFEIDIFAANYLKNFENTSLEKFRYKINLEDNLIEIDEYCKNLNGLYTIEVEFKDEESANNYRLPKELEQYKITEITKDNRFSNYNLSIVKDLSDVYKKKENKRKSRLKR
tara:strand:- start:15686 stop:16408 length:723 start_codon:yes stop_codon:yes gene_type:complete